MKLYTITDNKNNVIKEKITAEEAAKIAMMRMAMFFNGIPSFSEISLTLDLKEMDIEEDECIIGYCFKIYLDEEN